MQHIESIKEFIKINGQKCLFKTGELIFSRDKENDYIFLVEKGETRLIFKNCNRIIEIANGKIIRDLPPSDILDNIILNKKINE